MDINKEFNKLIDENPTITPFQMWEKLFGKKDKTIYKELKQKNKKLLDEFSIEIISTDGEFVKEVRTRYLNEKLIKLMKELIWYFQTCIDNGLAEEFLNYVSDDNSFKEIKKIKKELENWKSEEWSDNGISDLDIEKAKEVQIENYIEVQKVGYDLKYCICPFHEEENASLVIYKNNTFHCFGCGENGDSISFIKKRFNFGFVKAVKFLINKL